MPTLQDIPKIGVKLNMRNSRISFWMENLSLPSHEPLRGDVKADFVIVGGGFAGLSTAFHIKKADPGSKAIVLEKEHIGFGASGRNGGFSMTVFGASLSITYMLHGESKTREAYAYMVDAVEYLDSLVREYSLNVDYERTGFLRAATTSAYVKHIQREMEIAQKIGLEGIEWWNKEKIQEEVHSPVFLGGWWEPRCALVNPAKLSLELVRLARGEGADIYERSPVVSVEKIHGGVLVKTPQASIRASKVIFATNAWTHLFPWVKRVQIPAWTYMVATEPLSPDQWEAIGWKRRMGIEDARNLIHYFRPSPDGRLLMGGGPVIVGFGRRMNKPKNPAVARHLKEFIEELFPQLKDVRISHHWGGPFSVTLDLVPALGYWKDERIIYNAGCIGHGVSLMPSNGRILADLALERKTELTDLWFVNRRIWPWPPEPIRLLLSFSIRTILQIEDWWRERKGLGR